ncbi:hypothetical protein KR026_004658 [Drosophila bipectinata]|nr:hypothetical protein KR026_004658 [Drosophila bipectinata]
MALIMYPLKMMMVIPRYRNFGLLIAAVFVLLLIWMFAGRWGGRKEEVNSEGLGDSVPPQEGQAQYLFSQIYNIFWKCELPQPKQEEGKLGPMRKMLKYFIR